MLKNDSTQHWILNTKQMQKAEQLAINATVSNENLIQNAAYAVFSVLKKQPLAHEGILIIVGYGNNGADGYVLAGLLKKNGYSVDLACDIKPSKANARSIRYQKQWGEEIFALEKVNWKRYKVLVDAWFGSGLSTHLSTEIVEHFKTINQQKKWVLAIDVPSGVCASTGRVLGEGIQANLTVAFETQKIGHCLLPAKEYCGDIVCKPIGLNKQQWQKIQPTLRFNHPAYWLSHLPKYYSNQHKYTRGVLGIVAGTQMMGAVILAAKAALASGIGLVKIFCTPSIASFLQTVLHSVVMVPCVDLFAHFLHLDLKQHKIDTWLVGPGLLEAPVYRNFVLYLLEQPLGIVLDASMFTALDLNDFAVKKNKSCKLVMTPHWGEFKRFLGSVEYSERVQALQRMARITQSVVLLKGFDTLICNSDGLMFVNKNGCVKLSCAGSGDVLSGFIAGLMSQGMPELYATLTASYSHNEAAKIAKTIPNHLPNCMKRYLFS